LFSRYLKAILFLIPIIIIFNILINYIKIVNNSSGRNLSLLQNIFLSFEALDETKSEILSILDFKYILKNKSSSMIKKIYLDIELSSLEKSKLNIDSNPQNKKFFNAKLKFEEDESPQKIKFRMRGLNHWHHRLEKPSLRLKLKKENPYKMMKHINLTSPEGRTIIENYYPHIVAKKIGLTAHYVEIIELIINNKSYGIYNLISREDKSMVLLNKKMSGPLFLGKNLNQRWKFNDFEIVNGDSSKNANKVFGQMIETINTKKEDINWNTFKNLWRTINFEQTVKFTSLNNILGIVHNDYFHNHEFYFDPTKGRVEPIISDPMSLGTYLYPWGKRRFSLKTLFSTEKPNYKTPLNQKTNPLLNLALLDPEFYSQRVSTLHELIKGDLNFKNQKKYLTKIYKLIDKTVYNDRKKNYVNLQFGGWDNHKYSNLEYEIYKKNVFFYIEKRNQFIIDEINKNHLKIKKIRIKDYPNKQFLKIRYKGHGGLTFFNKDNKLFSILTPKSGKFVKTNLNKLNLYSGLKIEKNNDYQTNIIRGNDIFHSHHYTPDYQTYIFHIDMLNFEEKDINKFFVSTLTNNPISNVTWEKSELIKISEIKYNDHSLHIWNKEYLNDKLAITIGPGTVELVRNLNIKKNQVLKILPGTTLLMYPGVSIYSEGKIIIDGAKNEITIKRKYDDKSWGIIALQGDGTNGSVLKNLSVSGGSTDIIKNTVFSGMISFFWNKNIFIENLIVSNNQIGDDTMHFSNSNGSIKNLDVSKCFADCIDFDYSQYNLLNVNIANSKNDGLDFMNSKIIGTKITIDYAMDKGLSAGENSMININDIIIKNSSTGIAVKDLSNVHLDNVDFIKNSIAIDIYRKNWRYNKEGVIKLSNFEFNDNILDISTVNLKSLKFQSQGLNILKKDEQLFK